MKQKKRIIDVRLRRLTWGIFLCFSFNFFSVCSNEHENRKENETLATMQIGKNLLILFFFNNFSSCFYRRNITPNERLLVLFCDFFTSERDACGKKMFRFAYFYTFSLFSLNEETLRFDTFLLTTFEKKISIHFHSMRAFQSSLRYNEGRKKSSLIAPPN